MKHYSFCPHCANPLSPNDEKLLACSCGFIHYNNPFPVVATVVPFAKDAVNGIVETYNPLYLDPSETAILLVQRGVAPFQGEWCLPCGYINSYETPKFAAVRETREETKIEVRLEQLIGVCNPLPGELNQIVVTYLGRPVAGQWQAGDDALDARLFSREEMPRIRFSSHREAVEMWYNGDLGRLNGVDL